MKIIDFRNTNEALRYGLKHYQDKSIIRDLKLKMQRIKNDYINEQDIQKGLDLAFKHQFLREALETAEGKTSIGNLRLAVQGIL